MAQRRHDYTTPARPQQLGTPAASWGRFKNIHTAPSHQRPQDRDRKSVAPNCNGLRDFERVMSHPVNRELNRIILQTLTFKARTMSPNMRMAGPRLVLKGKTITKVGEKLITKKIKVGK